MLKFLKKTPDEPGSVGKDGKVNGNCEGLLLTSYPIACPFLKRVINEATLKIGIGNSCPSGLKVELNFLCLEVKIEFLKVFILCKYFLWKF